MLCYTGLAEQGDDPVREIRPDRPGCRIRDSGRIAAGTHRLLDAGEGALVIEGDDILLDFGGAELVGCAEGTSPDACLGVGIVSRGNSRLTIRNARIRGFKTAVHVQGGSDILIENCDLGGNYAMRLKSTPEREDGADWLWPHHNDANEWVTNYGASLYVEECDRAVIRGNRGRHSQNGILLDSVQQSRVYDNDFSFHSGWGLAMWRSCNNSVARNRFDWCVRGYSHGVYWRGQDSAGILVFEQCSDNVFALNSATHGGDGFFLYAGNQTLHETGQGGCNGNVLYRNDFSHAVANGIEATFSDSNQFIENTLLDCQHGVWAGYSYRTWIVGNCVHDCASMGVAIEHGSENVIEDNDFARNPTAIRLWWDENPDLTGGVYGRSRNTRSEQNRILGNRFLCDRRAVHLSDTQATAVERNRFAACPEALRVEGDCAGLVVRDNAAADVWSHWTPVPRSREFSPPAFEGTQEPFLPADALRGRRYITVGEWGPEEPTGGAR
jgi:nitrous oxidase accessory protein NosD